VLGAVELHDRRPGEQRRVVFTYHDPDSTYRDAAVPSWRSTSRPISCASTARGAVTPRSRAAGLSCIGRRNQVCSKDEIGQACGASTRRIFDYQIENLMRPAARPAWSRPQQARLLGTCAGGAKAGGAE